MTMQSELKALAERVMALTGPCRETDARIWCAVNTEGYNRPQRNATTGEWFCVLDTEAGRLLDFQSPAAFTASLDAAMTLVPAGFYSIEVFSPGDASHKWAVYLLYDGKAHCGEGASYALALTAAALLALAEQVPQ